MHELDIGDFCDKMEYALDALGLLIIKTDEVSGDVDLTEFNTLSFARDATLKQAKELLNEFTTANLSSIE